MHFSNKCNLHLVNGEISEFLYSSCLLCYACQLCLRPQHVLHREQCVNTRTNHYETLR